MSRIFSAFTALLILVVLFAASCRKETNFSNGNRLRFSTDTLLFDTVFTNTGSFTLGLKIFNEEDQAVRIQSVRMGSGSASPFRINVNGQPGPEVRDLELAAKDSIYVFALVRINPDTTDAPFFVEDSLLTTVNGRQYAIPFIAYGQNAHYINGEELSTQTWGATDRKPYVVLHSALVRKNETLTIRPGTRIYMHADSRLIVQGTLNALGTKQDSIIFQGDRLDRDYYGNKGYPGEWGGLYFDSYSSGNVLRHVILKNGGNSALGALPALIQVNPDSTSNPAVPQLTLDRVTLENSLGYGILAFNASIQAQNILVTFCGANGFAALQGGRYNFSNCTFQLQSSNEVRHVDQPAVALLNYFEYADNQFRDQDLNAVFRNCIIYGTLGNEILCSKRNAAAYQVSLANCLLKAQDAASYAGAQTSSLLLNTDPQYVDADKRNFHPKASSPVKNQGVPVAGIIVDRDDIPRAGQWDIGCYKVP